MKTERETTRIVRSWLEVGADRLPDRVLDSVLDELPAHRQRRRPQWPAWRFADMNTYAKMAIAAAAVLVVAILGYSMLPGNGPGGQATPTPIVTPTPSPTNRPIHFGSLEPGTYDKVDNWNRLLPYTVTVPAGWSFDTDGFISKGGPFEGAGTTGVAFSTWEVSHVYGDACQWEGTLAAVGTRQALATALEQQTGRIGTTSVVAESSVGGYAASRVEMSVNADFDLSTCQVSILRLWPDPGPDEGGGLRIWPGQTMTVYAVEKAGKAFALFTAINEASASGDVAELQTILDSVVLKP